MERKAGRGSIGVGAIGSGLVSVTVLISVVAILNMPDVNARHFFQADDWTWLYKAEFYDFGDLFSVLPIRIYNDRPIGAIAIKAGYELFGLSSSFFLLTQLSMHVLMLYLTLLGF